MTAATVNLLITFVDAACFLLVAVYCLVRIPFFYGIFKSKDEPPKRFMLVVFFGAVSCYGVLIDTFIGSPLLVLSIIGPIAGALTCGFWVGAGSGLIGAAAGFSLAGSPIQGFILLIGVLAGLYSLTKQNKPPYVKETAIVTFCCSVLVDMAIMFSDSGLFVAKALIPATALIGVFGSTGIVFLLEKLVDERETSAAKELIESELRIASNIQMSIVPRTFPPFPNLSELEVSAVLRPAKEIGGDLFDFFLIDQDHFFFAIGDVSSKGMPAALFMAVTRTLLRATAEPGISPEIILRRVNDNLCRGNDTSMFVTLFCGIVNIRSGEVVYSNAGHNPPYLYRRSGVLESIRMPEGMAMGVMEDQEYGQDRLVLEPGDAMVTYTDGVNEAMNPSLQQYENRRLERIIQSVSSTESKGIVARIIEDVDRFTAGAEQSDDITILSLTYTAK